MTTIETPIEVSADPSFAELRAVLDAENSAVAVAEKPTEVVVSPETTAKTETPDPKVETERPRGADGKFVAKEQSTEAEPGTVQVQEPEKTVEEELPPNVQKRIAKEVEKQARIDREIAEQVSRTKAKEAELAKLKSDTGKSGSEPVKTTEPAKEGKPVKPVFGSRGESWAEHQEDLAKYETDHEAYILSEAEKRAEAKWTERQRRESDERALAEAAKAHEGFEDARERVVASSSKELQFAISQMDEWASVVAHLGKPENAPELKALGDQFQKNPYAAVAALGRLEDRLKKPPEPKSEPAPKVTKAAEKPLPDPPVRVGGNAGAAPQVDFEKADMRTFKREIQTLLSR